MHAPPRLEARMLRVYHAKNISDQRHRGNIVECKQICTQAIVDVVSVVSDIVRQSSNLGFGARISP